MIKKVTVFKKSDKSDAFTMVLNNPTNVTDSTGFVVDNIDGLGPVDAEINTTEMVVDGDLFNSARIGKRNIVIDLIFYSETGTGIEEVRQFSYSLFPIKRSVYIEIETDNRKLWTQGYVEKNEPSIFSNTEGNQVSLICPDPKWYDSENIIDEDLDLNDEITIEYDGEVEVGGLLELTVGSAITKPVSAGIPAFTISCANSDGEAQLINIYTPNTGFAVGDVIKINSVKGNKSCIYTDTADADHNALNLLNQNPDWIKLTSGENAIRVTDSFSALTSATYTSKICYEGV
jgi:hypothetical protein